uniref:HECT-type E3 ubiquitin transferase n=1 Tax=Odontella aurita TaxID=265563 RepID=A0A6U6CBM7_9STRA
MARILTSIPQSLPFSRRVALFTSLLDADKLRTQDEERSFRQAMMRMQRDDLDDDENDQEWEFTGREKVEIRRDELYGDSMDQLNGLGKKLRRKVQVTFINQHGAQEAGIDGGGVFKEFLDDLIKDAFDPRTGHGHGGGGANSAPLFVESPVQTLQINPSLRPTPRVLSHYEFLGRVLGKAVYESVLVEPQFCLPFLHQLLGKRNALDDLKNLDPEYHRHLSGLRRMNGDDVESLHLHFEYNAGGGRTVELMPGGSSVPVTRRNVIRYVHLVAHAKLNASTSLQTRSFLRGFRDLVPPSWVRLFNPRELQRLIGGDDTVRGIDVDGLKRVTQYSGGYHPSQPIMTWFWEVLEEMSPQRQRAFLKFVTSCSRQPLLGFGALDPLPCVQQIHLRDGEGFGGGRGRAGGGNQGDVRLPTSSTCMNLLKLPKYPSKEILREKLLYAIEAGAGFELS